MSRISVTSMSEKGPLLPLTAPGYYKLHTQQPLHSSSADKQLLSSVTFIPNLTLHKGAVFKCQVSYKGKDKVVEEKVSDKFTVLGTCHSFYLFLLNILYLFTQIAPFIQIS